MIKKADDGVTEYTWEGLEVAQGEAETLAAILRRVKEGCDGITGVDYAGLARIYEAISGVSMMRRALGSASKPDEVSPLPASPPMTLTDNMGVDDVCRLLFAEHETYAQGSGHSLIQIKRSRSPLGPAEYSVGIGPLVGHGASVSDAIRDGMTDQLAALSLLAAAEGTRSKGIHDRIAAYRALGVEPRAADPSTETKP